MDDRTRQIEAASGAAWLGRMADQVTLAAVRTHVGRALDPRDVDALEQAAKMLEDVMAIRGTSVATPTLLHAMVPVDVVDATVEVVTSSSEPTAPAGEMLKGLANDVRLLRDGKADEPATQRVRSFFDRLSEITLAGQAQISQSRIGDDLWIQETSSYSNS